MKTILLTTFMTALMLTASAYAQSESENNRENGPQSSQEDDRNRDGRNGRNGRDGDDGELSRREMRIIDADGDSRVSVEEYMAHARQRFTDADTNGDNFISREEGRAASQSMRKEQDEARSILNRKKGRSDDSEDESD